MSACPDCKRPRADGDVATPDVRYCWRDMGLVGNVTAMMGCLRSRLATSESARVDALGAVDAAGEAARGHERHVESLRAEIANERAALAEARLSLAAARSHATLCFADAREAAARAETSRNEMVDLARKAAGAPPISGNPVMPTEAEFNRFTAEAIEASRRPDDEDRDGAMLNAMANVSHRFALLWAAVLARTAEAGAERAARERAERELADQQLHLDSARRRRDAAQTNCDDCTATMIRRTEERDEALRHAQTSGAMMRQARKRAAVLAQKVDEQTARAHEAEGERDAAVKRAGMALGFRVGHVDIVPTFGGRWMLTKAGPRFEEQIAHIQTATLHERFPTADAAFAALAAAHRGTP